MEESKSKRKTAKVKIKNMIVRDEMACRLIEIRKILQLTQKELAEKLNISNYEYKKMEQDSNFIKLKTAYDICLILRNEGYSVNLHIFTDDKIFNKLLKNKPTK